jgi:membrane protease YdiL (CAAX protease family)
MSPAQENSRIPEAPYWSYGDLGLFLLALAVLTLGLHVVTRLGLLSKSELAHPTNGLQIAIVLYLTVSLYTVLKLRYRRRVLAPLGWMRPKLLQGMASLGIGVILGTIVALCERSQAPTIAITPSSPLVLLAVLLAPILEESLFRGCLFPLIACKAGNAVAVAVTAGVFALFHGPSDLVHWISFGLTGMAYGLIRVISGTITGPAIAHSAYNLLLLSATLTDRYSG